MSPSPRVSIIVLSMGTRPAELQRCLTSACAQDYGSFEVFCLGMGWQPEGLPDGVCSEALAENIGSVRGRNYAVDHTCGELFLLLDDDAWLPEPDFLTRAVELFCRWPGLGILVPGCRMITVRLCVAGCRVRESAIRRPPGRHSTAWKG